PANLLVTVATSASTDVGSTASYQYAEALSPKVSSTCRAASIFLSAMTTWAPSRTNTSHVARPIPEAPPVTIAIFPCSRGCKTSLMTIPTTLLHAPSNQRFRPTSFLPARGFLPYPPPVQVLAASTEALHRTRLDWPV